MGPSRANADGISAVGKVLLQALRGRAQGIQEPSKLAMCAPGSRVFPCEIRIAKHGEPGPAFLSAGSQMTPREGGPRLTPRTPMLRP